MTINTDRLLGRFLDLVRIDSPPRQEGRIANYLEGALRELGFSVVRDGAGAEVGGETGNLIAFKPGAEREAPCLMLSAHMDTVEATGDLEPLVEDGVVRSRGETILGADDKAGVAAILEAVQCLNESGVACGDLEVVISICEEVGLLGARYLDFNRVRSRLAYVLDSGAPVGAIVVAAPSQDRIEARFHGRAAHAGGCPEQGINAIRAAAMAIAKINQGRIDFETTANVGAIHGGQVTNVVPDYVEVKAEARSRDRAKLDAQTRHLVDCFEQGAAEAGATVDVRVERLYESFRIAPDDPLVRWAQAATEASGLEAVAKDAGGGSDANIFNAHGLPSVVLGVGYQEIHSHKEWIAVSDLAKAAERTARLVAQVALAARQGDHAPPAELSGR